MSSTGQVLGARADQNNVTLDGANVNDTQGKDGFNSVLQIPLDSVQEFRTTIAGQGAELGHSAGGQVSILTKSGTNSVHGSVYEYNRNTSFEANDWFSKRRCAASGADPNQYGASVGGPSRRKAVFFYNWEGRKDRSQSVATATVPSDSFKHGIVNVLLQNGQTVSLTPADVKSLDPLAIGENPYVTNLYKTYASGNNPLSASDKGLNFNTLLFNAPQPLNNHVQVAKFDYILNSKHSFAVRGTLVGNSSIPNSGLALFPGQTPVQQTLDNSRGISARYTYVISPTLVNVFNYGFTRLGGATTGSLNVVPEFGFTTLLPTARGNSRLAPTPHITDDLTWTKGRHTFQMGFHFLEAKNVTTAYNNEPRYRFNSPVLLGLGNDITNAVTAYIQNQKGIPNAVLASTDDVIHAFGAVFGLMNGGNATYNFGIDGQPIPFGTPISRDFISRSPEEYFQDTWKAKPNLTITAGLRYSSYGVPYAEDGVQVVPKTSMKGYFAERIAGALAGFPNSALPHANLTISSRAGESQAGLLYVGQERLGAAAFVAYSRKTVPSRKNHGEGQFFGAARRSCMTTTGTRWRRSSRAPVRRDWYFSQQLVNTNFTPARYDGTFRHTRVSPASGGHSRLRPRPSLVDSRLSPPFRTI